jgi:hypothetical protein
MSDVISRGEAEHARLVHRWRAPIRDGATLLCAPDEEAAFLRHGSLLGSLGPGTHQLRSDRVPFLAIAAGPELDAELWFVSRALRSVRVRGTFAGLRSLRLHAMLSGSIEGASEVFVHDSPALLLGLVRGGGIGDDVGAFVARAAKSELVRAAEAREIESADLMNAASTKWPNAAVLLRAIGGALAPHGVAIHSLGLRLIPDEATRKVLLGPSHAAPNTDLEALRRFRAALQPGSRITAYDPNGRGFSGTVVTVYQRLCQVFWDGGGQTWIESEQLVPLGAPADVRVSTARDGATASTLPSASEAAAAAVAIAGTLEPGTRVVVDYQGSAYPAAVARFSEGWYEVAWENGALTWVPSSAVKPS